MPYFLTQKLPEQVFPLPSKKKPLLHSQMKLPLLFWQRCSQPPFDASHSLISKKHVYIGCSTIIQIIKNKTTDQPLPSSFKIMNNLFEMWSSINYSHNKNRRFIQKQISFNKR